MADRRAGESIGRTGIQTVSRLQKQRKVQKVRELLKRPATLTQLVTQEPLTRALIASLQPARDLRELAQATLMLLKRRHREPRQILEKVQRTCQWIGILRNLLLKARSLRRAASILLNQPSLLRSLLIQLHQPFLKPPTLHCLTM